MAPSRQERVYPPPDGAKTVLTCLRGELEGVNKSSALMAPSRKERVYPIP